MYVSVRSASRQNLDGMCDVIRLCALFRRDDESFVWQIRFEMRCVGKTCDERCHWRASRFENAY